MTIVMDQEVRVVKRVEGQPVYNSSMPKAKRIALERAKNGGYVASLPQILHSRAISPAGSEIWQDWFTANSEEDVGETEQGNAVVVAVHGCGLWTPDRIIEAYVEGLTSNYAGKLGEPEFLGLLKGKLADGRTIPVYSLSDFMKGIPDLPMQYAVVMDFDRMKGLKSGVQSIDSLRDNPLFIVRAGGQDPANKFLDQAKVVYGRNDIGHWHPFASTDPSQPQGRVPFAGLNYNRSIDGHNNLNYDGRLVGVAPEALGGQKIVPANLEARIQIPAEMIVEIAGQKHTYRLTND